MLKVGKRLRRSVAVLSVAVATFVATGSGAQAATSVPPILNGIADAQALHINLQLPTLASLQKTLSGVLGVPVSGLPALPAEVTNLLSTVSNLDEVVSLNHGEVLRGIKDTINHAQGFAQPLDGSLKSVLSALGIGSTSVSSSCVQGSGCTSSNALPEAVQNGLNVDLPAGLGSIKIAGAQSVTKNLLSTQNLTGLVNVKLGLSGLLGTGGVLAPVGDVLKQLTDTLNTQVIGAVNDAVTPVIDALNGVLEQAPLAPVKAELDKLIDLKGVINAIPDLTKADLLDLSVLTAGADVVKSVGNSGAVGVLSTSNSKIANLDILKLGNADGWAHVDAINLATKAFANGVKADSIAEATQSITGGNLGGLLGLHISNTDLADLLNGTAVTSTLQQVLQQAGLPSDLGDSLVGAVKMLYKIAGITVENVGTQTKKTASFASASAGTLKITVAPQIPALGDLVSSLTGGAAALPDLSAIKTVPSGIKLSLELPNASSVSAMGNVHGVTIPKGLKPPATTGVATPFVVAFALMGAAIIVKRYALAK
jgi:hypothetical protein